MRPRLPCRGAARLRLLLRAARGRPTTTSGSPPPSPGSGSRPGPAPSGATPTCCRSSDAAPGRPRRRLHPAGPGRPPGGRARPGRAVDQGRHRQPDRLVQGPGGLGRPDQGAPARLQGRGLRLDRQPGQLGGRPRGPGRHGLGRAHPPRPRGGQGDHDRRLRRHGSSPSRAATTTSTGSAPSSPASSPRGPSSTSTSAPTTPRARRPWPSRSPSSWAGRPPTTWWCPIGSGSQLTKVAKGFAELCKVGLLDEEPPVRVSGAQAEGCSPVATAFAEGTDAIRPVKPRHHRQVAGHRQPGRRLVRARRHPHVRRVVRRGDRRRGRSTASGSWPAPRGSSPRPPAA